MKKVGWERRKRCFCREFSALWMLAKAFLRNPGEGIELVGIIHTLPFFCPSPPVDDHGSLVTLPFGIQWPPTGSPWCWKTHLRCFSSAGVWVFGSWADLIVFASSAKQGWKQTLDVAILCVSPPANKIFQSIPEKQTVNKFILFTFYYIWSFGCNLVPFKLHLLCSQWLELHLLGFSLLCYRFEHVPRTRSFYPLVFCFYFANWLRSWSRQPTKLWNWLILSTTSWNSSLFVFLF